MAVKIYPISTIRQINAFDKFLLHGKELVDWLDGGLALHLNFDEALPEAGYRSLLNIAARTGCNYFCVNVRITICNDCGHIDKRTLQACSGCGSHDIDYGICVIGYLKRVSAFSSGRRKEHALRHYHRQNAEQETGRLTRVPGVGKKTAECLLLELKGKLALASSGIQINDPALFSSGDDILRALLALGYSEKESNAAIAKLPEGVNIEDRKSVV